MTTEELLYKAEKETEQDQYSTETNEISVKILKVNKDTVCVEFINLSGPQLPFLNV